MKDLATSSNVNPSIHIKTLLVWVGVCLYVSNKRQNSWTDPAQVFYGIPHDTREGFSMITISNICLQQNSISNNGIFSIVFLLNKKWAGRFRRETENENKQLKKQTLISNSYLIFVKRALPFFGGESLEITHTVPLNERKEV